MGDADGLAEGFGVGTCVFVGAPDGEPVGNFVGDWDGLRVGDADGQSEGF